MSQHSQDPLPDALPVDGGGDGGGSGGGSGGTTTADPAQTQAERFLSSIENAPQPASPDSQSAFSQAWKMILATQADANIKAAINQVRTWIASPVDSALDPRTSAETLQSVMYLRAQAVLADPSALNRLQATLQNGGQALANANLALSNLAPNFQSRLVAETLRRTSINPNFANVFTNATDQAVVSISVQSTLPALGATEGENGVVPGYDGGGGGGSSAACTISDQPISGSVVICVIVIVAILVLAILGAIFG